MGSLRSTSTNTASVSTTCTVTKPAGTALGDILIAAIGKSTTATPSGVPAGWAVAATASSTVKSTVGAIGNLVQNGCGFYWKEAGGSEPADYTWTSILSEWIVTILCFQDIVIPLRTGAGAVYGPALFDVASAITRTGTALSNGGRSPGWQDTQYDHYWYITAPAISDVAATRTLSALTGVANTVTNNALLGISMIVGYDELDFAALSDSPVTPEVSCTIDSAAGSARGFSFVMADPIARPGLKPRRPIRRRPPLSQVAI